MFIFAFSCQGRGEGGGGGSKTCYVIGIEKRNVTTDIEAKELVRREISTKLKKGCGLEGEVDSL